MDGKVSRDVELGATQQAPSPGAEKGHDAKPTVDGLRFHDQSRFRSSEVTRAFVSAIRAVSQGAQSEVSDPDAIALEPGYELDS
jgi:hypothetical protein